MTSKALKMLFTLWPRNSTFGIYFKEGIKHFYNNFSKRIFLAERKMKLKHSTLEDLWNHELFTLKNAMQPLEIKLLKKHLLIWEDVHDILLVIEGS